MVNYSVISKEEYLKQEDNPFRIINLIASSGGTVKVRKPTIRYPVFETKLKDYFIYISTCEYHGWTYQVYITSQETIYDNEYGYIKNLHSKKINSEEFYDLFKKLYEQEK